MSLPKIPSGEICCRCGDKAELRERDSKGVDTGRYVCKYHYWVDYRRRPDSTHNIIKSIRNNRTGNVDSNSTSGKGDNSQELACKLYGWEDLNKKYDNYGSPVDCYDPKTGLYHQVQGRYYDSEYRRWPFGHFEREWKKEFEDIVCFCFSEDGERIERIYRIPFKNEIKKKRKSISIYKNHMRNSKTLYWYEKYRIDDEEELNNANDIWQKILEKKKEK